MYRRCAYHFSLVDPDHYSGSGAKIQIFRLWSISQNLLIWAFLVIAQSEDMVVCYISFSNIEELQRICGDVMTKKLKIMQFLTYNSSISPLTRHCITSTYRATCILHFIYWLQSYTLCLVCIMFQFLNISSLYKHFFSHLYLCQLLFDLNEWRLKWKVLRCTTFHITIPKVCG